eukprot:TRINITY_DN66845_c3_g4_i1.p1 TRINITY_DN66845_c3_g4~~TRINITY_DN66845_c3_g4_i1.p1  ORF type:complete len:563 (+),score=66.45 TRINITY_DN66845_c3_g4_i1:155-1690(+)
MQLCVESIEAEWPNAIAATVGGTGACIAYFGDAADADTSASTSIQRCFLDAPGWPIPAACVPGTHVEGSINVEGAPGINSQIVVKNAEGKNFERFDLDGCIKEVMKQQPLAATAFVNSDGLCYARFGPVRNTLPNPRVSRSCEIVAPGRPLPDSCQPGSGFYGIYEGRVQIVDNTPDRLVGADLAGCVARAKVQYPDAEAARVLASTGTCYAYTPTSAQAVVKGDEHWGSFACKFREATVEPECTRDNQCSNNQYCRCNTCVSYKAADEACQPDGDACGIDRCGGDFICDPTAKKCTLPIGPPPGCTRDDECGTNGRCACGICTRYMQLGENCQMTVPPCVQSVCASGLNCYVDPSAGLGASGVCRRPDIEPPTPTPPTPPTEPPTPPKEPTEPRTCSMYAQDQQMKGCMSSRCAKLMNDDMAWCPENAEMLCECASSMLACWRTTSCFTMDMCHKMLDEAGRNFRKMDYQCRLRCNDDEPTQSKCRAGDSPSRNKGNNGKGINININNML